MGCVHGAITLRTVLTAARSLSPVVHLLSIRASPGTASVHAHEAAKPRQLIDIEASAAAVYIPRGAIELLAHNSRTSVVLFLF